MNNTRITVVGRVGTSPDSRRTSWGDLEISFRLAAQDRHMTPAGEWEDGNTSWYTVRLRKQIADNVRGTIEKGMQLIVSGKLRIRAWQTDERSGIAVEIDADHVGPDLAVARATVQRIVKLPDADARPTDAFGAPQPGGFGDAKADADAAANSSSDGWAIPAPSAEPVAAAVGAEGDPPF